MKTETHSSEGNEHAGRAPEAETRDVVTWRRVSSSGQGSLRALPPRLAASCSYDLHALIELVERGCPPVLAARILAPLDDRAPAVLSAARKPATDATRRWA